jgi:hypothetical protein
VFPAANIEVKAFGNEQDLTDDELKEAVQAESGAERGRPVTASQEHTLDNPGGQSARRHRAQSVKCNENATPSRTGKIHPIFSTVGV